MAPIRSESGRPPLHASIARCNAWFMHALHTMCKHKSTGRVTEDSQPVYSHHMEEPIVKALRWAREDGMNQTAFAGLIGCTPQDITNWKKRGMPAEWHIKVAHALGRSVDELLGHATEPQDQANVAQAPDSKGLIPLISWVQAGHWNGAHDPLHPGEAERWLECPATHSERTYALRVRGDSMTAPHGNARSYPEGCIIYVDPLRKSPVNGQRIIAKLKDSDEVTFKVFKQEDGRIWLQPINPMHQPITDQFKVLGTVIGKWEDE